MKFLVFSILSLFWTMPAIAQDCSVETICDAYCAAIYDAEGDECEQEIAAEPKLQTWYNYDRDTKTAWFGIEDVNNGVVFYVASAGSERAARRKAMRKLQTLLKYMLEEETAPH